jgi:altronate dehydratase small subunit
MSHLTDPRLMLLSPGDSVYVLRDQIAAGEAVMVEGVAVSFAQALGLGHKIARLAVACGDKVIKYGAPIGRAARPIAPGDHVHLHNLASDYTPTYALNRGDA